MPITRFDQLDLTAYYTYQDYMSWKFNERVELFLGRVFKMSPAPNVKHQEVSGHVFSEFYQFIGRKECKVFSAPFDVRLPVSQNEGQSDTVVQPDIVVICDLSKLDEHGCNGAPDIVVEILSQGNSRKELKDKFALYEASKVPEYWIIDPSNEDIIIYSLNENECYTGSKPYVSGDLAESQIIVGLRLDVGEVFKN
jgi:Uma2 family endonuclease